jgi:DNA polymerase III subunit gamma/tau
VPKQALYLKWRPTTFDDMVGQEHITRTLRNSLKTGRIRHAYLFSGPRGTGKTTSARLLAKAINCHDENPENRPCDVCSACVAVNEGRYLDLIEIDAASHTGVDDVRDLRDKIAFSPGEGQYKVYIIDEVHRFSGSAFDALLKTLEEPPDHAIFILATTEIDKVPPTIKSFSPCMKWLTAYRKLLTRKGCRSSVQRWKLSPEMVVAVCVTALAYSIRLCPIPKNSSRWSWYSVSWVRPVSAR